MLLFLPLLNHKQLSSFDPKEESNLGLQEFIFSKVLICS